MTRFKRHLLMVIIMATFLVAAVFVWYSPVLFKGYAAHPFPATLILARNLSQSGVYGLENNLNVVLAPDLVKEQAQVSGLGNRLTPQIYAQIFKVMGQLGFKQAVFLACLIHALALLFFMLVVRKIWGFKKAVIFGTVYIFLPIQWTMPYLFLGSYEFATLFFSIFVWLYFGRENERYKKIAYVLAGVFLTLAMMAKEAFTLFVPIFLFYLFWTKKKKELLTVGLSFLVVAAIFWLPGFLRDNAYLGALTTKTGGNISSSDFLIYGEFFNDPYSYHFQKEEILAQTKIDGGWNSMKQLSTIKLLYNVGLRAPTLYERLSIGTFLFFKQNFKLFSLEQIGGPLVFVLISLGLFYLWKREREKATLFLVWVLGTFFLFAYIVFGSRSHVMDVIFPLVLLISLGVSICLKTLKKEIGSAKLALLAQTFLMILLIYNFIQTSHLVLSRIYDDSPVLKIEVYAQKIKENAKISARDVIAVGNGQSAYQLNYQTGKSTVIFNSETIIKLLKENRLKDAFEKFGVAYVIGYDKDLSKEIIQQTKVEVLAEDLPPMEPPLSNFKKQFMNFFR